MSGPLEGAGAGVLGLLLLAGALGAVLRLACDHWLPRGGIVLANVLGCLVAGTVAGLAAGLGPAAEGAPGAAPPGLALVLVTGLAGALTTFSTVSVSTARDVQRGRWGAVLGAWAVHLAAGLAAVVLGLVAGTALAAG
ncbi:CrcB family protein [Citricoccus sp. SGAir0253]|uniref:fluoride efflux transporter FluC n=1 Tax=Citricoccus sp. SGAir0253 TaxID=2567881 RepID=UPI00143D98AB|nr:CrcB family protein [Citricoccus sp. SGAir0253]